MRIFEKKCWNTRGFAREFLRSCMGYGDGWSVKKHDRTSSLHSKKIFCLGVRLYCEWRHQWRTFRPPCPAPGTNR